MMYAVGKKNLLGLICCLIFLGVSSSAHAKEWKRAYFASYPRSGNHWLRYLIEEASGIATGSVYLDKEPMHMDKVFPWGGYTCDHGYKGNCRYPTKDDIVFIKTHYPSQDPKGTEFDRLPYVVTLRCIRHPIDSFYSRYVKRTQGPLLDKVPHERVKEFIVTWRRFQEYWDKKKNVVTIRYEDLLANPFDELKKVLILLKYDVTYADIERAVAKYPPQGYMLKSIDKFTDKDIQLISDELNDLLIQFGYEAPITK